MCRLDIVSSQLKLRCAVGAFFRPSICSLFELLSLRIFRIQNIYQLNRSQFERCDPHTRTGCTVTGVRSDRIEDDPIHPIHCHDTCCVYLEANHIVSIAIALPASFPLLPLPADPLPVPRSWQGHTSTPFSISPVHITVVTIAVSASTVLQSQE